MVAMVMLGAIVFCMWATVDDYIYAAVHNAFEAPLHVEQTGRGGKKPVSGA